jgi:hypothetical protein
MASSDVSNDADMKALFDYLKGQRKRRDVSFVIVHHHRKKANDAQSKKRPNDLSDVYGSYWVTAEPDFVLDLEVRLDDEDEGTITMSMLKNRYAEIKPPVKIVRNKKLHFDIADDAVKSFLQPGGDDDGSSPSLGL